MHTKPAQDPAQGWPHKGHPNPAVLAPDLSVGQGGVYSAKLHWMFFAPSGLAIFVSLATLLLSITSNPLLFWGAMLYCLASLFYLASRIFYASNFYLGIDRDRIMLRRGLLSLQEVDVNGLRIESVLMRQSLLGRIMGYGTLYIKGIGASTMVVAFIDNPREVLRRVSDLQSSQLGLLPQRII